MTEHADALVKVIRDGRVAIAQLNRPDALNALSPEMMDYLLEVLRGVDSDPTVGAVVIAGHQRAFVAGADIKGMATRPLSDVLRAQSSRFWMRLADIETPMIAAVSGAAFGGGCELALACDMIVASVGAQFSQAEITLGIMPGGGGTQRLTRALGKHKAMELVLTGRRMTADEASALGIVNRVVAEDDWYSAAVSLARQVADGPPIAIRLAKKAVLAAENTPLAAGMQTERRLMELTFATGDRREGMNAFIEKRPAQWRGI